MPLTANYQQYCITGAIKPAVMWGCFWSVADAARGAYVTPKSVARSVAYIFTFQALICPLEQIHGKRSALHDAASMATIGYIGISANQLGIPFPAFYTNRHLWRLRTPLGAAIYGALGLGIGMFNGKPI